MADKYKGDAAKFLRISDLRFINYDRYTHKG